MKRRIILAVLLFISLLFPVSSYAEKPTSPKGDNYLDKINPEVQLKDNGWLKIVEQYLIETPVEEYYKDKKELIEALKSSGTEKVRRLHVQVQFLKPCTATVVRPQLTKESESTALLMLDIFNYASTDGETSEEELKILYKDYKEYCIDNGIDPFEFAMNAYLPRFRCDYRTKVFITFYTKEGHEINTEGEHPIALLINKLSEKRKKEMLPSEKTYLTFSVPDNAESWYVWLPK